METNRHGPPPRSPQPATDTTATSEGITCSTTIQHGDIASRASGDGDISSIITKGANVHEQDAAAARKPPAAELPSTSPLSRLESPLSTSAFSSSPSSTSFLPLSGAAAFTPLSSLDGGEAQSPASAACSVVADDRDEKDANEVKPERVKQAAGFPFLEGSESKRSEKGEASSAPRVVGAATIRMAAMAQSAAPIRASNAASDRGRQEDTRSRKSSPENRGDSDIVPSSDNSSDNTPVASGSPTISSSKISNLIPQTLSSSSSPSTQTETETQRAPQNPAPPTATTIDAPSEKVLADEIVPSLQSSATPSPDGEGLANPSAPVRSTSNRSTESWNISRSSSIAGAAATTTALIRPKFTKAPALPLQQPAIVRTVSSRGELPLRQPVPDPNARPVVLAGNIAILEATAEQLSRTSSIENAIREAHQELKRSDSKRSSILAANLRKASSVHSVSDTAESSEPRPRRAFSRQSSIIGLNSAARSGVLSPNDFIMSPSASVAGSIRQRSASKASSTGSGGSGGNNTIANFLGISDQSITGGDDVFPFLSRHGPGKSSVRTIGSGKLSLPEIAELEPPITLTQDALDAADRLMASGEDHDDDDTIRASAHQQLDADAEGDAGTDLELTPNQESWARQPMLGSSAGAELPLSDSQYPPMARPTASYLDYQLPPQAIHNPMDFGDYYQTEQVGAGPRSDVHGHDRGVGAEAERPKTSGSGGTFDQAQSAFHDFDGVHCDPETTSNRFPEQPPLVAEHAADAPRQQSPAYKPRPPPAPRPTTYLDPETGRQMLYYPARVPAMLQLPPKLSRTAKAGDRNKRRSQVLSMMMHEQLAPKEPKQERQSRVWLPDPLSGDIGSPLLDGHDQLSPDAGLSSPSPLASPLSPTSQEADGSRSPTKASLLDGAAVAAAEASPVAESPRDEQRGDLDHLRRPSRLLDSDKRKSRMSTMSKLPPQLRASAYFDLPATTAEVEVKNGSAMDTLDSILDAAASAPVSAFTDHAFAGHLGSEVYGTEKKRNKRNTMTMSNVAAAADSARKSAVGPYPSHREDLPTSKSRGSILSIVGHIRKVSEPLSGTDDRRMTKSRDGDVLSPGLSEGTAGVLAPDDDERPSDEEEAAEKEGHDEEDEEDEDEDDEGDVYQGPPTTLLAELQLRKQQQKLRTRPINRAFPNGMHSTLLELDAVAEVERKARKGKRVNLAWEDPTMNLEDEDGDDEDVPLGMLFAAKAAGNNDISAVAAEMNRPLGLMEKKELEDNEPLSRRRERLQGRDPGVSMFLGPTSNALKRQSMLTLTPTVAALNSTGGNKAGHPEVANEETSGDKDGSDAGVEEVEDEPLASRLRRMKAKEESELPRARPVSTAFSAELLSQFGDPEEEAKEREKELEKERAKSRLGGSQPAEEEETLGQRRRRLQAEKEARDQEMGGPSGLAVNGQALHALTGSGRLSRRVSLANILSAHPLDTPQGRQNPREVERMRQEQEAARAAREKEQKMAAMRAMMPQSMSGTSLGGGVAKPGGYMGGRFNDGVGGIGAVNNIGRTSVLQYNDGPGVGPWANPGAIGGPMGNASVLNLASTGSIGNMAAMGGMGPSGNTYGSRLNNMGMMGMGAGMNQRNTSYGSGYGMPQQPMMSMNMNNGMGLGYNAGASAYGAYAGVPMQTPMQMQMPMPQPQGQIDRVERWRQGVLP